MVNQALKDPKVQLDQTVNPELTESQARMAKTARMEKEVGD